MQDVEFYISDTSVYIPEYRAGVEQIAEWITEMGGVFPKSDVERFKMEYHFDRVPVEIELDLEGMVRKACEPLLDRVESKGQLIDRVILVRTSQVYWHDHDLLRSVRNKYSCLRKMKFLSLGQQNCATIHLALRVAKNFFATEKDTQHILILTADKAFHPILRRIPDSLNGDSSSAVLLSRGGKGIRMIDTFNYLEGSTYDGVNSGQDEMDWFNATYYFSLRQIIRSILHKHSLEIDDIKFIFGSNVNYRTWSHLSKMVGCSIEKFYTDTISKVGHLYCSDIFYNISMADSQDLLSPDDLFLSISIGLGGCYGCSLHRYSR